MVAAKLNADLRPEAFPTLHGLPELKDASDSGVMRDHFGRCLRPAPGKAFRIEDCALTRLRRNLQSGRCILQYNLRLADSTTGSEQIQWATGVIYPNDRAENIWQSLQSANSGQCVPNAFLTFHPISFIPELRMLVQLFPYDRRLPALPLLVSGPPAELQGLLLDRFGAGSWQAEQVSVKPIRYRAGLAVVLRYTVQAREKATRRLEQKRFYVKIYRDDKGEQIYQVLQALWARDEKGPGNFKVGRPVAYLSALHALIQEEASGVSFEEILLHGQGHEAESAARRVARALATLHLSRLPVPRRHLLEHEVAVLEKARKTLQWASPNLKEELDSVVRSVVGSLRQAPLSPTHLDLKTDHILLDSGDCTLLDLDSFALADPVLDVAHVLAQIAGLKFADPVAVGQLQVAASVFREEYFNHVPIDWRSRLPAKCAGAALKVALGFFRRQEQKWPEKVAETLQWARRSLVEV